MKVTQSVIDADAAHSAVGAAVKAATKIGAKVNVAVVDSAGVLAAFLRMPGAALHSVDVAIDEAYTAVSFGLPTSKWNEVLQSHSAVVRDGIVLLPRFVALGGGLPLVHEGERIGAIGVSGASEEQDEAIAEAGVDALGLK